MPFNVRQYEVPAPFFTGADGNIVALQDLQRIQAYKLYEDLYNNNQNSLKIVLRGDDALPIYMPSGKKIINATNRFLGKNMEYFVEPVDKAGLDVDEGTRLVVEQYLKNLYKREAVKKKFASQKRWGLIKADAGLMLYADPNKAAGERISVYEVDPSQVFAIEDAQNRLVGYHMVERVRDFRETDKKSVKQICKRSTWRRQKDDLDNFTGIVTHEVTHWEIGKWDDRVLDAEDLEQVNYPDADEPEEALEAPISRLPIYMWHNDCPPGSTWGTSLLSGLETLIFGINQSLTDEDLTLVMQGLGMFVTNAAQPINVDTGEIMAWNVGPGQVIEVGENQEFTNVTGVQSVSPFQDHMNFMDEKGLAEASGTPAVAIGRVDVQIAESGVSLKLQLDPLLAANQERELELYVAMDQFHHDLVNMWLPAYEQIQTGDVVVSTVFDDPMPENRDAVVQEVTLLWTSDLILTSMAVDRLSELGWKYPPEMDVATVVAELEAQAARKAAALDPFAAQGNGSGGFDETDPNGEVIDDEEVDDTATVDLGVT